MTKAMIQEREEALKFILAIRVVTNYSSQFTTTALMRDYRLHRAHNLLNRMLDAAFYAFDATQSPGTWSTFSFHDRLTKSLERLEEKGCIASVPDQKLSTWAVIWDKI